MVLYKEPREGSLWCCIFESGRSCLYQQLILDKAEILNKYFTSVFTPISLDTPPPPAMDEPLIPDIDPNQVDTNGVV